MAFIEVNERYGVKRTINVNFIIDIISEYGQKQDNAVILLLEKGDIVTEESYKTVCELIESATSQPIAKM